MVLAAGILAKIIKVILVIALQCGMTRAEAQANMACYTVTADWQAEYGEQAACVLMAEGGAGGYVKVYADLKGKLHTVGQSSW